MLLKIELYGALRKFAPEREVEVEVMPSLASGHADWPAVRNALLQRLGGAKACAEILETSALAQGDEIVHPGEPIVPGQRLAVLPPVCGG